MNSVGMQTVSSKDGSKHNPATDPRKMRRIIAEDPEWNLEIVTPLVDLCIAHIANNFHENPIIEKLLPKHKVKVLEKLSPDIPLSVTGPLISDEVYWARCCHGRWKLCDVADYDQYWKRMYFERNCQEMVETFVPDQSDTNKLEETLKLSSRFVRRLRISQLLPPSLDKDRGPEDGDADVMSDDALSSTTKDHLDCGLIVNHLKQLEEISLIFGVNNCGMNFNWSLFEFTAKDCKLLAKGLKATPTLRIFRLNQSKVHDQQGRLIVSHLLDHPSLSTLDMSHNSLGDGTGRAIGKLLNGHAPKLTTLNLNNNVIGMQGGVSIGHALQNNNTLLELSMKLNTLGDEGGQAIFKALLKNSTLTSLNIGSNFIGEASGPALLEMLMTNKTVTHIDITCNKLGEAGGKLIQEGMDDNQSLLTFDLRLTEISQDSEYCINQIVKTNQDRVAGRGR